jgi:hypothetical protein
LGFWAHVKGAVVNRHYTQVGVYTTVQSLLNLSTAKQHNM